MCLNSVAERLLELGEVNFANLSLRVVKPTLQLLSDADDSCENINNSDDVDDDDEVENDGDDAAAVIVSNIPKTLSEEYLSMFLENSRRSGGGEITDMQFDQKSATAVVRFASPQGKENFVTFVNIRSKLCPVILSDSVYIIDTKTTDVGL